MHDYILKKIILDENATLRDAMLSFDSSSISVVLICNQNGKLLGLATEGDVRRALLQGFGLAGKLLTTANQNPIIGKTTMAREEMVSLLSEKVQFLPIVDDELIVKDVISFDKRSIIPVASPSVGERELQYVTEAILSGWISSQGKFIGVFEQEFAKFCGSKYGVAVSNGTVSLHLALSVLGIGPRDEVIVPALTFVATAAVVRHCHATPVCVDIDPKTWNIDPVKIEAAITENTKAIIPVHLYGNPCEMDTIKEIGKRHNLFVIEDAAEAHGATYAGVTVGSIGDIGSFSFFGNKIITTGEGGMLLTDDERLYKKMKILRDHGMNPERKYWHDCVGFNYRMTNLQAAIGVAQLEKWDQIIAAKENIKKVYDAKLNFEKVEPQVSLSNANPVCWLYSLILKNSKGQISRDALIAKLKECGIESRPLFFPLPAMPPYFIPDWETRFPVSKKISESGFSLPSSVELEQKDLIRVVDVVNSLL